MGNWPTVEKGERGAMLGFKEGLCEAAFLLSMHWDHELEGSQISDLRFQRKRKSKRKIGAVHGKFCFAGRMHWDHEPRLVTSSPTLTTGIRLR